MIRRISRRLHSDRFDRFLQRYNLSHSHFGISRRLVSRAVLVGLFLALLPVPAQMLLVVIAAALLRFNVVVALGAVWLSNPLTMPLIFYAEFELGQMLLMEEAGVQMQLTLEWFAQNYRMILSQLAVGALATATVSAVAGYLIVERLWVRSVRKERAGRGGERRR